MKELSIEEKAQAYDKAIKVIKDNLDALNEITETGAEVVNIQSIKNCFYRAFPELKEDEDERIREALIENFKWFCGDYPETTKWGKDDNLLVKDIIAWLEKQGEHTKFRDSIQVGDKVTRNENGVLVNLSQLKRLAKKDEKQGEQKPQGKSALEAINEEKVDNANKVESKQEKLTEFEKAVKQVMEEAIECGNTHNLKADTDMLLSLVHKSAWSEEDEKRIEQICEDLRCGLENFHSGKNVRGLHFDEIIKSNIDWLKDLKDRHTWKPSDKQMNTLEHYMRTLVCNEHKEILFGLYSDLKKLREE